MIEIQEIFMQIQEKAFDDISENCNGCKHLLTMKDPYGTGDSPTEYECEYNEYTDCPHVQDFIVKIKYGVY